MELCICSGNILCHIHYFRENLFWGKRIKLKLRQFIWKFFIWIIQNLLPLHFEFIPQKQNINKNCKKECIRLLLAQKVCTIQNLLVVKSVVAVMCKCMYPSVRVLHNYLKSNIAYIHMPLQTSGNSN